jgi:hypothetical protein
MTMINWSRNANTSRWRSISIRSVWYGSPYLGEASWDQKREW